MKFFKQISDGCKSIGQGIVSIGEGMSTFWKEPPSLEDYRAAYKTTAEAFAEDAAKIKGDWEVVGSHLSAATEEVAGGFSRATTHLDAAAKEALSRATKRT